MKSKPLTGAMTIVGKDNQGNKLILPTKSKHIKTTKTIKPSWIKKIINLFKVKEILSKDDQGNITSYKMHKLTKRKCELICEEYNEKTGQLLKLAQETRKNNQMLLNELLSTSKMRA